MTFSKKTLAFGLLGLVLPMLLIYTTNLTELPQVIDKLCGSGIGGFSLQETYIYSPPAAIVLVAIYIYICHKQGWRFAHLISKRANRSFLVSNLSNLSDLSDLSDLNK